MPGAPLLRRTATHARHKTSLRKTSSRSAWNRRPGSALAARFTRREPRLQARSFLLGVLSEVDTRSCWQLAEQAGDETPRAMQRLLGETVWDADAVRDDVRSYVVDAIGDPGGVLILDDTGDLKRGTHSVGVQRQYTGTAGRGAKTTGSGVSAGGRAFGRGVS